MIPSVRPLREFSFWIHPPSQRLMAVFKAYVDDSGDEQHGQAALSMGGYIATIEQWARFEQAWGPVLAKFSVSYLHMKELVHRRKVFVTWTEDEEQEFLCELAALIGQSGIRTFGSVVVLDDLKRFNDEHKLHLDPKALAIYISMMELRIIQPNDPVEVILDRMNRGHAAIAKVEEYAIGDQLKDLSFLPLPKKGTYGARDMPPFQAADFLAWEIRKEYELRKPWYQANPDGVFHVLPIRNKDMKTLRAISRWFVEDRRFHIQKHNLESINIPWEPHRRSLIALDVATPINAHIWNYHTLEKLHEIKGGSWGG